MACIPRFGLHLHEITWVHIVSKTMKGTGVIILFIFLFIFCILFRGFSGLVDTFLAENYAVWWIALYCFIFLLGYDTPPLLWNFSLSVSSFSHNFITLLILLVTESNPFKSRCFCPSLSREKLTSSIFSSLGNPWSFQNGGKCLISSKILFTWKKNSRILNSWVVNKPQRRYLFWCWSAFGGK